MSTSIDDLKDILDECGDKLEESGRMIAEVMIAIDAEDTNKEGMLWAMQPVRQFLTGERSDAVKCVSESKSRLLIADKYKEHINIGDNLGITFFSNE